MFTSESLNINEQGHLTLGGADTMDLAKRYGTPIYVFDETLIRTRCRDYQSAIARHYEGNGAIAYASKAFSCLAMDKIMQEEGMYLDAVSGGEIYTALQAGFPAERILFHGNNKSEEELAYALEQGVGRIVADSLYELERIQELATDYGKTVKVLLRVTPGVDAHTHSFIKTGQIDSKFGVTLENGDAEKAVKAAVTMDHLDLVGLHCHIGSQIFDTEPFLHTVSIMLTFVRSLRESLSISLPELDMGGGFAIRYTSQDTKSDYHAQITAILQAVKITCEKINTPCPFLFFEPGRSMVGEAGITLYTVGRIKEIPGIRNYVSVDGGMTDNPRYALYHSDYEVVLAEKAGDPKTYTATIAGKCCESGDLIQENCPIQPPEVGDVLAVLSTGAYCYSMSSNYNRLCKPPVVFVKDGVPRLVVARETYADLIRNDIAE